MWSLGVVCVARLAGVTGGGLKVTDIDAYWLQRKLSKFYDDANVSQRYAEVWRCRLCLTPLLPVTHVARCRAE